jgi:hypothetical protein
MPIIPTAPFAQTPNLAGAAAQAANIVLQRQQLQQREIESQRNAQLQAQQIAAQSQISSQRAAAAQAQAAIDNQMQQARFGLAERELGMQEQELQRRTKEAADRFQAQSEIARLTQSGMPLREATMRVLPQLNLSEGAMADLMQEPRQSGVAPQLQVVTDPETGERKGTSFPTGPNSNQWIPDATQTSDTTERAIWTRTTDNVERDLKELQDLQEESRVMSYGPAMAKSEGRRTAEDKKAIEEYEKRNTEIAELKAKIDRITAAGPANYRSVLSPNEAEQLPPPVEEKKPSSPEFQKQFFNMNAPGGGMEMRSVPGANTRDAAIPPPSKQGGGLRILNMRRKN